MPVGNLSFLGALNKIGTPVNGKQTYEVVDEDIKKKFTYTVPVENADKFEKAYNEYSAIQDNMKNPEEREKLVAKYAGSWQKNNRASALIGGAIGAVIPAAIAIFTKGSVVKRSIWGTLGAIVFGIGGILTGGYFSMIKEMKKVTADPGMQKLIGAAKNLQATGAEEKVENL